MRRLAGSVFSVPSFYFVLAALLAAAVGPAYAFHEAAGIGAALVSLVYFSTGVVESAYARRKLRHDEEYHQARMGVITPVIEQERIESEYVRYLIDFNKQIKGMSTEQLKVATLLAPGYIDFVGVVDEKEKGYYTEREARLVIYFWSEDQYGHTYLPTQHDRPSGSRIQMIIKRVTDDLLAAGVAQREYSNARAFLTVGQDEAFRALFPVKG